MTTATKTDIEKALAEMSAEYATGLDARVANLRAAMTAVRSAGADEASELAQREAHRLRGSAGSFGFDAISEAAERLELALVAFRASDGSFAQCEDAYVELVRVCADARRPPPESEP